MPSAAPAFNLLPPVRRNLERSARNLLGSERDSYFGRFSIALRCLALPYHALPLRLRCDRLIDLPTTYSFNLSFHFNFNLNLNHETDGLDEIILLSRRWMVASGNSLDIFSFL